MLETSKNCITQSVLIKLDKNILDQLDLGTIQLPLALHLMMLQTHAYVIGDATFRTSPETIYDYITHGAKPTLNQYTRNKVLDAIGDLIDLGLIEANKQNFLWNTKIEINASNLLHENHAPYVSIQSSDLCLIMRRYGLKASKPIIAYFNITSYFDWRDVTYYLQEYADTDRSLLQDIRCNPELGQDWHISCYASLKTLASKRYYGAQLGNWVTEKTLSSYIQTLSEIGLISIVTTSKESNGSQSHTMRHYCLPNCERGVRVLANRKLDQMIYAKNKNLSSSSEEEAYNEI